MPDGRKVRSVHVAASIQAPPPAQGTAGAFWLKPVTASYGAWPASGEIDVFGSVNARTEVTQGLHYGQPWPGNEATSTSTPAPAGAADWSTGMHTYAVDWEADKITTKIDGREAQEATAWWTSGAGAGAQAPFDQPFTLVL